MSEWKAPDSWIVLYEHGTDAVTYIDTSEAMHLDTAVAAYLESGKTRDELLSLKMTEGEEYRVPLSNVRAFFLSTPTFRGRNTAMLTYQREENIQLRSRFGLPYKEDDD